ncbi:MAG: hypothetical protein NVV60_13895 [Luteimonas sp.]|nr:hypothetical protein [Luteimonas sp.]
MPAPGFSRSMANHHSDSDMILYCWRDGSVGAARKLPAGAIELARGGKSAVNAMLLDIEGVAGQDGLPQWPGLAAEADEHAVCGVLRGWMRQWARKPTGAHLTFNHALDLRFVGAD